MKQVDFAAEVATVAKGARRNKSVYRGKLDLFYTAEFSFYRSRRSELCPLLEADRPDHLAKPPIKRLHFEA